eukprot:g25801.t1
MCRAINLVTGASRVVKTIKKPVRNIAAFNQEMALMKRMDHPNIIKLMETFEDYRNIYFVLEVCAGGEVLDHLLQSGFSEGQVAVLMQQLLRGVYYMHANGVCHRNLTFKNLLLQTKGPIERNLIKIGDLGLACQFKEGQVLTTKAGTPYYVAPQVLTGKYDAKCDLWSCGIIMYVLLCGYPPFTGASDAEILGKVRSGAYTFQRDDWSKVSEDAKNLTRLGHRSAMAG